MKELVRENALEFGHDVPHKASPTGNPSLTRYFIVKRSGVQTKIFAKQHTDVQMKTNKDGEKGQKKLVDFIDKDLRPSVGASEIETCAVKAEEEPEVYQEMAGQRQLLRTMNKKLVDVQMPLHTLGRL